jgi:hypothetical protein
MKKFLMTIIISIFPLLVFGQSVSWTNLTSTAELGRQQSFSLLDNANSIYVIGGGINDEIVSYNGSQYYVVSGTASSSFPYTLSTKNNNGIYSTLLGSQYIYTESLNNTFNVFSCSGSQPYPGSLIWTSPDGAVWTSTTQTADPLNGAVVEWDGWIYRLGGVCACPTPVYSNKIARSSDGLHFATVTTTGVFSARDGVIPIVSTDGATLYVVGGHYNAGSDVYYQSVYKTTDGATWTSLTTSGAFGNITQGGTGWSYNNILYVYNNATGFIYSSLDGITWSAVAVIGISGPSLQWASALYTGNNSLMVMGGYNGASYPNTAYYGSINTSDLTPTLTPVYSTSMTLTQTLTITQTYTSTPASAWWTPTPAATLPFCPSPFPAVFTENPTPILVPTTTYEQTWLAEPNVIDTGIIGASDRFHITYSGNADDIGGLQENIAIITAPIPEGPWTRHGSVIGNGLCGISGGAKQSSQLHIGTEYRVYFCSVSNGAIYYATSIDGYNYFLNTTPVISPSDFSVAVGCVPQEINGLQPVYNPNTGTYIATIEVHTSGCPAGTPPYVLMLVESTDGAQTFHIKDNAPLSGISPYGVGYAPLYAGGRATFYVNGHWATFPHIDYPTYITYAISPDLYNWQTRGLYSLGSPNAIRVVDFINTTVWGLTSSNQAADSSILEYNGNTYLFYSHDDNTNGAGRLGYSKFSGTLSDYDACFIPSASPTITNTVTITPIVPTSTITPTFTATPVLTPNAQLVNSNTYNARVRWPNSDSSCTYLIQYGLSLEESQALTQDYNISNSNNYFEVNIPGLIQGATNEIRITQYNPNYNAVVSNIIYVTPTPIPAIQDVIMTPTP